VVGSESGRVCAVRCLGGRLIATRLVKAEDSPAGTLACHARPPIYCVYIGQPHRPAIAIHPFVIIVYTAPLLTCCLQFNILIQLRVWHHNLVQGIAACSSFRLGMQHTYLLPQQPIRHQHITSRQIVSNRQSHARLFILHFKQRHVSLTISLQYFSENT
jgi:hypothetical protein